MSQMVRRKANAEKCEKPFEYHIPESAVKTPGITWSLRIPLIIVPNPATSSPPTRISRKSAIQAHCLHAK